MSSATKYISSIGELRRKDHSLIFRTEQGHTHLPVQGIKEIYLLNETSINTKLLDFLAENRIVVHFFNYYQHYSGTFYPRESLISGTATVAQVHAFQDRRLEIAQAIVVGIAINVHQTLYHYYKHDIKELKPFIDWLASDVPRLVATTENVKQLLFIEGSIWKRFYDSFQYFLPEDFLMNKRVRRPPDNPINALISFGNSLLYTKTISQIYQTHLNQTISFLHEPAESRFSLSLDLCEVFKPILVFKTIFELVNNKKLKVDKHFDKQLNYCLLNEEGSKLFIQAFEDRLKSTFLHATLNRKVTYHTAIKLDGYKLLKAVTESKKFNPFSIKEKK